jgi:Cu-Zn family superoxide dismutase
VIHAGKDDYKSDPAGNAGDRIACGVIGEGPATVGVSPRP